MLMYFHIVVDPWLGHGFWTFRYVHGPRVFTSLDCSVHLGLVGLESELSFQTACQPRLLKPVYCLPAKAA